MPRPGKLWTLVPETPRDLESVEHTELSDDEDHLHVPTADIMEDLYGFTLVSTVRDLSFCARSDRQMAVRMTRLVASCILLLVNISIQAFLLNQIKGFITEKAVHDIQDVYDRFELHMYGGVDNHTTLTVNGKHRGIPEYFNASLFNSLDENTKRLACRIPLSQPAFLMVIILVWTLTCAGELRQCIELMYLLQGLRHLTSMQDALEVDEDCDNDHRCVTGITVPVKAFVLTVVIAPRICITLVLLWLGCRWLTATPSFADILLNGVALEFILYTKDLLYNTVVPTRNKKDVQNTKIRLGEYGRLPVTAPNFLGSFVWFLLAVAWVQLYCFHFEQVLPVYRWDVHGVCHEWIEQRFA